MEGRNSIFVALKPSAVALSEAILTLNTSQKDIRSIESRLETLDNAVKSVAKSPSFDGRLADYVFFPVAQILKHSQQISLHCLELSLSIVAKLIRDGWQEKVEHALAQQLLALCTLLASKNPPSLSTQQSSPELQALALECLEFLISGSNSNAEPKAFLTGDVNIPQLGQLLSTVLDRLEDSPSRDVQASAVAVLETFSHLRWPSSVLWSFLPGIVSALTKVLRPVTQQRRAATTLVSCLHVFGHLLKTLLGDNASSASSSQAHEASAPIRNALSTICKLEAHDKAVVRDAVCDLLILVLRDCSKALENCVELAVETLITISSASSAFKLSMLVSHSEMIKVALQSALHDWSISLVRIMQSSDDIKKTKRIAQIESAHRVLSEANVDLTTVNHTLTKCLADGIVVLLQANNSGPALLETIAQKSLPDLSAVKEDAITLPDQHDGLDIIKQSAVADKLASLIRGISITDEGDMFMTVLSRASSNVEGTAAVANFWLMLTALRAKLQSAHELDLYLQVDSPSNALSASTQDCLETAYSMSLGILSSTHEERKDIRLRALALQTFALRAQSAGRGFRYELVESLYPVLEALADPTGLLRHDSITALNTISEACEYDSVQELILDNVDYLTNAVALKLNAFDVSPQAPQILLLMIRLAGPRLLPYLDDSVESIFAALEDYHGYPLLVELLFRTLAAMAEEGSKAPALTANVKVIEASVHVDAQAWRPATAADLASSIRDRVQDQLMLDAAQDVANEPAPQRPWKSDDKNDMQPTPSDVEKTVPPAPKTYDLVFRITEMSQHFLPSASPSLRLSLLTLICTAVPAIAQHEDSFLPLVNTLWPEIVSRLDEEEPAIMAAALDTIAVLCEHAKSFMRSRINDIWPRICAIWRVLSAEATVSGKNATTNTTGRATNKPDSLVRTTQAIERSIQSMMQSQADYSNTSLRRQWLALVNMLTTIVKHVPIGPEIFDDALEMVRPDLANPAVDSVFTACNADAVWLCKAKSGLIAPSGSSTMNVKRIMA